MKHPSNRIKSPPIIIKNGSLCSRFIVPPFSVLDARQGYWAKRKHAWLSLGVRGDFGRNKSTQVSGSWSGSVPHYYAEKSRIEKKLRHKLSNAEFENKYLFDILKKRNSHLAFTSTGAAISVFDPVLCEIVYCWFCPPRGNILDPFAGESTKGLVAAYLKYNYVGIELRLNQIRANQRQSRKMKVSPKWIHGDAANLNSLLPKGEQYDLVFTSPPYFDLEVYSKEKNDASTFHSYKVFMKWYRDVFRNAVERLRENRFMVVKVGEIRDKQGIYRNFVGNNISCFTDLGLHYYNEIILITPTGSLPIRAGRQFAKTRKVGKNHQNILVFFKGDPLSIKRRFSGDINIVTLPE